MSTVLNRTFGFDVADIKNLPSLGEKLGKPQDEVSQFLKGRFSEATQQSLSSWLTQHQDGNHPVAEAVVQEFNGVIHGPLIYDKQRFDRVNLSNSARVLHTRFRAQREWQETDAQHFNQVLIKDTYPVEIWRIWLSDIDALKNPEDEEAWKEAYEVLWPVANRAARNSPFSETDIKEIALGAILEIRRALTENQKFIKSGRALIGMTARRSRWNTLTKLGKRDPLKNADGIEESPDQESDQEQHGNRGQEDDSAIAPDEFLKRMEDIEFVRRALARLDERQRTLLIAREIDKKSYEELQQQFNLSSSQVGVYLKRARERLKTFFEEERDKPQ